MYRLYLDEVGVEAIKRLHSDNFRFLSLTGVAMKIDHARDFLQPALNLIKAEVFDQDPDQPIIFHRTDIIGFKGPFEVLRNDLIREDFDRRLLRVMRDANYRVITALIDKRWMVEQIHWNQTHPYNYLMEIIVEKYAQFLKRMSDNGDIMPEARGKKQDKSLQEEFDAFRSNGTRFVNADLIQSHILSKKLKFRTKKDNIAGLQLCDLLAHSSHYTTRQNMGHSVHLGPFSENISKILVFEKYDRSYNGEVRGYGMKHIP